MSKFFTSLLMLVSLSVLAQDIEGISEHPMIERYPGQVIAWQHIENFQPYKVPIGPVTGYRAISDWVETSGRVTRTFYKYQGEDRTYTEIYKNYFDALSEQKFEILASGMSADRKGVETGSRQWMEVTFIANPTAKPGEVATMFAGTSSSGGAGAIVAKKQRAIGTAYVVIYVEQHAKDYVGTLIDIVEQEAAQTGLVRIDAQAIGSDIAELGRVVLDGILFEHDKATLKSESDSTLNEIANFLKGHPEKNFYVVGHTDSTGTFAYNRKLSQDRAQAVIDALTKRYNISSKLLEAHGVGPLVPVFTNTSGAGRDKNRRVELVEK